MVVGSIKSGQLTGTTSRRKVRYPVANRLVAVVGVLSVTEHRTIEGGSELHLVFVIKMADGWINGNVNTMSECIKETSVGFINYYAMAGKADRGSLRLHTATSQQKKR